MSSLLFVLVFFLRICWTIYDSVTQKSRLSGGLIIMPAICFFHKCFDRRINHSFRPFLTLIETRYLPLHKTNTLSPLWDIEWSGKVILALNCHYRLSRECGRESHLCNLKPALYLRRRNRNSRRERNGAWERDSLEIICFIYSDIAVVHHSMSRQQLSYILWLDPNMHTIGNIVRISHP